MQKLTLSDDHADNDFDQWSWRQWLWPMTMQKETLTNDHACRHWLCPMIMKTMTIINDHADNDLDPWYCRHKHCQMIMHTLNNDHADNEFDQWVP